MSMLEGSSMTGLGKCNVRRYSSSEWRIEEPSLCFFERKRDGWYRRRIVGYQIDPGELHGQPPSLHPDDYDAPVRRLSGLPQNGVFGMRTKRAGKRFSRSTSSARVGLSAMILSMS